MTLSIDRMFAFISVDEEGEGIIGFQSPMGWMPMVGADEARIESLRPLAQRVANAGGKKVVLACFEQRTDLEILEPDADGERAIVLTPPKP